VSIPITYLCLGCKQWFEHEPAVRRRGVEVYCSFACLTQHKMAMETYAAHNRKLKVRMRKRWVLMALWVEKLPGSVRRQGRRLKRLVGIGSGRRR